MSGPEFLSAINAVTALETPQIVLTWEFTEALETPLTPLVPWKWIDCYIRRSLERFPESISEGTSIFTESYSDEPPTSKSDTNSLLALRNYYYSMFFSYEEHSSSALSTLNEDISRLGSRQSGVVKDQRQILATVLDGATTAASAVINSAGSTFRTDFVEAGHLVLIADGGADDGFYTILSVNSETQLTIDANLTLTASNVNFTVINNDTKYWISGVDYKRDRCIWRWNTNTNLVDFKVNLSAILTSVEPPIAVLHTGTVYSANSILILTEKRYIRIPYELETVTELDIINEWDFAQASTVLTAGFEIVGGTFDAATNRVYLLDRNSAEVVSVDEVTGLTLNLRTSLLALDEITLQDSGLVGVAFQDTSPDMLHVAHRNRIISFVSTEVAPNALDIVYVTYARQQITADICVSVDDITDAIDLVIVDDTIDVMQSYTRSVAREYLWQQPNVCDKDTIGLYHFEDGSLSDETTYANTAINNGMTADDLGRFGGGFTADAVTEYINLIALAGEFNGLEGSASFWFKAASADQLNAGTQYLLVLDVNANNRVRIGIVSGSLRFEYVAGGVTESVVAAHPSADTEWHHYCITWSDTADQVKCFVDGVQFGTTQTSLSTFVGILATCRLGGASSDTSLGTYDECHFSKIARTIPAKEILYTSANRMHANAGRDYTADYDRVDPLAFAYRDELFTAKYMGGEYMIRNDYERAKLHPPDKTISSRDEVIFRDEGEAQPLLGDMGRTTRMLALMVDRIADDRELMETRTQSKFMDVDFMDDHVATLGLLGFDTDNWNVDMKRRFLDIMPTIHKRGGRGDSYHVFARLLGFYATKYTLTARRRWDSVIYSVTNPIIQPIYLDQMGSMDTGDVTFPLALLRFLYYKLSKKSTTGTTSVAASRLLTDVNGTFLTSVNVGSLIVVAQDEGDGGTEIEDSEYIVTEVHSDTVLKVDKNWSQGSNTNVTYYNYWKIPEPDPHSEYLNTRFRDIAPNSMRVERLDDDATL